MLGGGEAVCTESLTQRPKGMSGRPQTLFSKGLSGGVLSLANILREAVSYFMVGFSPVLSSLLYQCKSQIKKGQGIQ